jgi:hypothetical protein
MNEEDQQTLKELKYSLTGVKKSFPSHAPLLGNTHQWWYGREVRLDVDKDYVIGVAAICTDWQAAWDLAWRPTRINLGNDSIWVYIHQNYWESTPESIDHVVLTWATKLKEEFDAQL